MHGTTAPAKDAWLLFLLWARTANARLKTLKPLLRGDECNRELRYLRMSAPRDVIYLLLFWQFVPAPYLVVFTSSRLS